MEGAEDRSTIHPELILNFANLPPNYSKLLSLNLQMVINRYHSYHWGVENNCVLMIKSGNSLRREGMRE